SVIASAAKQSSSGLTLDRHAACGRSRRRAVSHAVQHPSPLGHPSERWGRKPHRHRQIESDPSVRWDDGSKHHHPFIRLASSTAMV
ncbi:hypothetical protein ABTK76_19715, partial [Acinetobacter baumannii]